MRRAFVVVVGEGIAEVHSNVACAVLWKSIVQLK